MNGWLFHISGVEEESSLQKEVPGMNQVKANLKSHVSTLRWFRTLAEIKEVKPTPPFGKKLAGRIRSKLL